MTHYYENRKNKLMSSSSLFFSSFFRNLLLIVIISGLQKKDIQRNVFIAFAQDLNRLLGSAVLTAMYV